MIYMLSEETRAVTRRAAWGFLIGVSVLIVYWLFGFLPREIWFGSWVGGIAISLKGWLWPSGILTIGPHSVQYVLWFWLVNGLTYAILSAVLFVLRSRLIAYLLVLAATLALLLWLNGMWDAYSWISFSFVLAVLLVLAWHDLRLADKLTATPKSG